MENKPIGRGLFRERPLPEEQIELNPTKRQEEWLRFLNLHGALPSSYLFDLEGEKNEDQFRAAQVQLRRIWHGGYVYRPKQQRATDNANYHQYVYDLTDKGIAHLKRRGLFEDTVRPTGNWVHQLFVSCVTATMDIMCRREGYRYIPPHEYLNGQTLAAKVPFVWDKRKITMPLAPDAVFAIDYGENSFIAYALEADRKTETGRPTKRRNPALKTYERVLKQYAEFIGRKLYRQAYKREAMMVLLFFTVTAGRADSFLRAVDEEIGPCAYVATGVVPEFITPFRPPRLLSHLFSTPLPRAGKEPFVIKKTA